MSMTYQSAGEFASYRQVGRGAENQALATREAPAVVRRADSQGGALPSTIAGATTRTGRFRTAFCGRRRPRSSPCQCADPRAQAVPEAQAASGRERSGRDGFASTQGPQQMPTTALPRLDTRVRLPSLAPRPTWTARRRARRPPARHRGPSGPRCRPEGQRTRPATQLVVQILESWTR
jgi:hypothetical protein